MSGGNWRDTDEGYWIGVVEGMEAAARIVEEETEVSSYAFAGTRYDDGQATLQVAAENIRRAMTEGEIGKRSPARAPDLDPDTIASFWAKGLYDHLTRCRDAGDETGCAGVIAAIEEWRRLTIQLNARRALAAYSPPDNEPEVKP